MVSFPDRRRYLESNHMRLQYTFFVNIQNNTRLRPFFIHKKATEKRRIGGFRIAIGGEMGVGGAGGHQAQGLSSIAEIESVERSPRHDPPAPVSAHRRHRRPARRGRRLAGITGTVSRHGGLAVHHRRRRRQSETALSGAWGMTARWFILGPDSEGLGRPGRVGQVTDFIQSP